MCVYLDVQEALYRKVAFVVWTVSESEGMQAVFCIPVFLVARLTVYT